MKLFIAALVLSISIPIVSFAQKDSTIDRVVSFPNKLFSKIIRKTSKLNQDVDNATDNYLKKLSKQEDKFRKIMNRTDSTTGKKLFSGNPGKHYQEYLTKMQADSDYSKNVQNTQYQPYADSMGVTLQFLKDNPQLLSGHTQTTELENSIQGFNSLEQKIQGSDQLASYVSQTKLQIKQYLMQQANVPGELTNLYNDYNKSLYEYSEKIQEYKDDLNDPDKMFKLVLQKLEKIPSFQSFVEGNSLLASLFPTPVNPSSSLALNGLQSRSQLQQIFQGRLPATPSATNSLTENVQNAKSQLDDLKDRLAKYGQNGDKMEDPNYQKNTNKKKALLRNLEYEFNFQVQPSTYALQSYVDFGLGIGYKIGKSNIVGVGFDYHLGYGQPLKNIHLSSQGIGFRTYIDVKLKSSIYFSGGYELNQNIYNTPSAQSNLTFWQPSGLLGISKIVTIKSRFAKKTKVQILWDFLSYYNFPKTPPFKFRIGYAF